MEEIMVLMQWINVPGLPKSYSHSQREEMSKDPIFGILGFFEIFKSL